MDYKIELNTKTAKWEIFLSKWSDLWYCKIKGRAFDRYEEAQLWCQDTGMDRAYRQRNFPDYLDTENVQPRHQPLSQTGGILKPKRVRKTA